MNSEVMMSATSSLHQVVVPRDHLVGRKGKTLQQVELGDEADNLSVILDRIGVEIVALEHLAQFVHRQLARHRLDSTRHVAGDGLFEKFIQGAIHRFDSCGDAL